MARKPSQASHSESGGNEELNLSPIMALLVILIPMLLAMFNFFEVKVQAVAAPKLGTGKTSKTDPDKKPLNLTVLISKQGFLLKQQDELQDVAEKPIPKDTFEMSVMENGAPVTKSIEDYDFATLYSRLRAKKQRYPDETTINIAAEMDIPWHVIARTIDASRVQLEDGNFEGRDRMMKYASATPEMRKSKKDIDGDGAVTEADQEPVPMFPRVVFVVAED
ncbi:MAG: hypothetical protein EP329_15270 [Deltaproteobacteria bacterium]|nr:MAG: hypothetical protein EP329_15270 [Deltaproteobacteria bacterium]